MGASIGVGLGLRHTLAEDQARGVVSVIGAEPWSEEMRCFIQPFRLRLARQPTALPSNNGNSFRNAPAGC